MRNAEKKEQAATHRPKIWHEQQEEILRQWAEIGSCYRYLHDRAHRKFRRQNMCFTIPIILLSTITGTANFAQGSFSTAQQAYIPLMIGALNLITGMLSTMKQFLQVAELSEGHRGASLSFGKLSRNIRVELSLPWKERSTDGADFLKVARADLDRLLEQSPPVPLDILVTFDKKFGGDKICRPEIMDIHPVAVYNNDKEKQEAHVASIVTDAARLWQAKPHSVTTHHRSSSGASAPSGWSGVANELASLQKTRTVSSALEGRWSKVPEKEQEQEQEQDGGELEEYVIDVRVDGEEKRS